MSDEALAACYKILVKKARGGELKKSCMSGTRKPLPAHYKLRFDQYEDNSSTLEVSYKHIPDEEVPWQTDWEERRSARSTRWVHNCGVNDDWTAVD